jgi:hypothetical protein
MKIVKPCERRGEERWEEGGQSRHTNDPWSKKLSVGNGNYMKSTGIVKWINHRVPVVVVKGESAERLWRLQNQGRSGRRGMSVQFPVIIMMVLVNTVTQCQLMRQLHENKGGLEDWFFTSI